MSPEQERAWWEATKAVHRPGACNGYYLDGYNGPPPNIGPRRWNLVRGVAKALMERPLRRPE